MSPRQRLDWAKDLPFEVKQVGRRRRGPRPRSTTCSGSAAPAPTRTARRRRRARSPSCSTPAGVTFAVLGDGETCTGDPARRAGNEFLFQMLAQQNVEVLSEARATKIVVTCAHCFNTLENEYPQLGGKYEVRPPHPAAQPAGPREAGWSPVAPGAAAAATDAASTAAPSPTTTPATSAGTTASTPRRASCIGALPGVELSEMPRARRAVVLLRRRRRPDVDGGEARHPDQHQPHRRRPSPPGPTGSPSAARSAGSCSPTGSRRSRPRARRARRSRSSTSPRCCSPPSGAGAGRGGRRHPRCPRRPDPAPGQPSPPARSRRRSAVDSAAGCATSGVRAEGPAATPTRRHPMTQYAILIYGDETAFETRRPRRGPRCSTPTARSPRPSADLGGTITRRRGARPDAARRPRSGGGAVTDGPFVETKETLGGFYLVEAARPRPGARDRQAVPGPGRRRRGAPGAWTSGA